jgi:hypothetical protein
MCIKKFILLFYFVPFSAFSDWKYIGRDVNAWYFIEPVQISKQNYSRKVWIFFDPTLRSKDYDYSLLCHKEYDCKNERSRIIGTVTFPGFVPEGSVFFINPFEAKSVWFEIAPYTVHSDIMEFVCSK